MAPEGLSYNRGMALWLCRHLWLGGISRCSGSGSKHCQHTVVHVHVHSCLAEQYRHISPVLPSAQTLSRAKAGCLVQVVALR